MVVRIGDNSLNNLAQADLTLALAASRYKYWCLSSSIFQLYSRFLLCGQDVTGEAFQATGGRRTSTSSTAASCLSSTGSGPASLESTPGVASKTIQVVYIIISNSQNQESCI